MNHQQLHTNRIQWCIDNVGLVGAHVGYIGKMIDRTLPTQRILFESRTNFVFGKLIHQSMRSTVNEVKQCCFPISGLSIFCINATNITAVNSIAHDTSIEHRFQFGFVWHAIAFNILFIMWLFYKWLWPGKVVEILKMKRQIYPNVCVCVYVMVAGIFYSRIANK